MKDYAAKKAQLSKLHTVEIYQQTKDIFFICQLYRISKESLAR